MTYPAHRPLLPLLASLLAGLRTAPGRLADALVGWSWRFTSPRSGRGVAFWGLVLAGTGLTAASTWIVLSLPRTGDLVPVTGAVTRVEDRTESYKGSTTHHVTIVIGAVRGRFRTSDWADWSSRIERSLRTVGDARAEVTGWMLPADRRRGEGPLWRLTHGEEEVLSLRQTTRDARLNANLCLVPGLLLLAAALAIGLAFNDRRARRESRTSDRLPCVTLADAVGARRPDEVQRLLATGADPDAPDEEGRRPLHHAAGAGSAEVLALLLERRPDLEARDTGGSTPLHVAVNQGRTEMVRLLLEAGADARARDQDGRAPLVEAVGSGHRRLVALLLEHGADPDSRHERGEPVLHDALWGERPAIVRTLLEHGATVDLPDADGRTPLEKAVTQRDAHSVRFLLEAGADARRKDADGTPLLHRAIGDRALGIARVLLAHGADPNAQDAHGYVALFSTVDHEPAMRLLLEHGASPDAADRWDNTVLQAVIYQDRADLLGLLLAHGARLDGLDAYCRLIGREGLARLVAREAARRGGTGGPRDVTSGASPPRDP